MLQYTQENTHIEITHVALALRQANVRNGNAMSLIRKVKPRRKAPPNKIKHIYIQWQETVSDPFGMISVLNLSLSYSKDNEMLGLFVPY